MILKIKGDWQDILNDCRSTVGKEGLNIEPSEKFKKDILISEHSPIRSISIRWMWVSIKSWVATHWSRHKWECFIETRRSDRTGIDRDKLTQDELVNFIGEANIQHHIDSWRKRLCRQASEDTRVLAVGHKMELHGREPEISDVLVPNCIYRCGCPEINKCPRFETFKKIAYARDIDITNIQARYDLFNEIFYTSGW